MVALLVLLAFLAFLAVDLALQHRERPAHCFAPESAEELTGIREPPGAFLDAGHTWVALEPSGAGRVGMDAFAAGALGHLDGVELPPAGRKVSRGEPLFSVRQGGRLAHFVSPLDGVVLEANQRLASHASPGGVGASWLVRIRPSNLASNLKRLRIAEEARRWLAEEMARLQDLLSRRRTDLALGEVSADGGAIARGFLRSTDPETWSLFVTDFLNARDARASLEDAPVA